VPGLYFVGVPFQYAFSSMLVAGAGRDARFVAEHVAKRVHASDGAPSVTPAAAAR
jgi:putative flavoprotein involved in K+ transport